MAARSIRPCRTHTPRALRARTLHIILAGNRTASTTSRPTPLSMPSFAWKLNDRQITDVATYARNSWGNRAQPVGAKQVGDVRRDLALADR